MFPISLQRQNLPLTDHYPLRTSYLVINRHSKIALFRDILSNVCLLVWSVLPEHRPKFEKGKHENVFAGMSLYSNQGQFPILLLNNLKPSY